MAEDGDVIFQTWENSAAVRNLQRDRRASVLIDKVDQPYAGVHYTGEAHTWPCDLTPDEYAELLGRYFGDLEQAARFYEDLNSSGLGRMSLIRFHPATTITWDFAKIPQG
jgi:hypothetical protein